LAKDPPAVVGKELEKDVPAKERYLEAEQNKKVTKLEKVGSVTAHGKWAMLSGYVVVLASGAAADVLGYPRGQVNRIDVVLEKGVSPQEAREAIAAKLAGRARVQTPLEQSQAATSAVSGL